MEFNERMDKYINYFKLPLEFHPFKDNIEIFDGMWENYYQDEVKIFFTQLKQELRQFLYSFPYFPKESDFTPNFLELFHEKMCLHQNSDLTFLFSMGLNTSIGFSWTCQYLLHFYDINKFFPSEDKMSTIVTYIKTKNWRANRIYSWKVFISRIWKCKFGLNLAVKLLTEYCKDNKQIPNFKNFPIIYRAIVNGCWAEWKIYSWSDILKIIPVKYKKMVYGESIDWRSRFGLIKAKSIILSFFQVNGKIPQLKKDVSQHILRALQFGYWKKYGINTWEDLLNSITEIKDYFYNYSISLKF